MTAPNPLAALLRDELDRIGVPDASVRVEVSVHAHNPELTEQQARDLLGGVGVASPAISSGGNSRWLSGVAPDGSIVTVYFPSEADEIRARNKAMTETLDRIANTGMDAGQAAAARAALGDGQ